MTDFTTIDLHWTGRPKSIASLLIESAGVKALVDPGPQSTLPTLRARLGDRGIDFRSLDTILLTHIHLDHAGATGSLLRENPNLKVYVHELGAPHMADPARLLASAGRLYGGELRTLYGDFEPVPKPNLLSLRGGELIRLGNAELVVHYTPGHASHHVTFWEPSSGTALVGDTAGVRVEGDRFLIPATPPPDIDLESWNASLDKIASWNPSRLFLTHFGYVEDAAAHIAHYKQRLEDWVERTRRLLESGADPSEAEQQFIDSIAREMRETLSRGDVEHYMFNAGLRLSWLGLLRYVRKRTRAPAR